MLLLIIGEGVDGRRRDCGVIAALLFRVCCESPVWRTTTAHDLLHRAVVCLRRAACLFHPSPPRSQLDPMVSLRCDERDDYGDGAITRLRPAKM